VPFGVNVSFAVSLIVPLCLSNFSALAVSLIDTVFVTALGNTAWPLANKTGFGFGLCLSVPETCAPGGRKTSWAAASRRRAL
jgi:hypothetical protein